MPDEAARPWLWAAAVVCTVAYAVGAAWTTPFTQGADVMTAIPIGALAVGVVVCWPLRPARDPLGGGIGGRADGSGRSDSSGRASEHPYRAWVVLTAVVVAWELAEYARPGTRGAHPTLSSMADAVDRVVALKAVVFLAWIWLCVAVVRAGRAVPGHRDGAEE